jgi:hypothetical protein
MESCQPIKTFKDKMKKKKKKDNQSQIYSQANQRTRDSIFTVVL